MKNLLNGMSHWMNIKHMIKSTPCSLTKLIADRLLNTYLQKIHEYHIKKNIFYK